MQSTTAADSIGLAENALPKANAPLLGLLAVAEAAWYGSSSDPRNSARKSLRLEGDSHLGIRETYAGCVVAAASVQPTP